MLILSTTADSFCSISIHISVPLLCDIAIDVRRGFEDVSPLLGSAVFKNRVQREHVFISSLARFQAEYLIMTYGLNDTLIKIEPCIQKSFILVILCLLVVKDVKSSPKLAASVGEYLVTPYHH